VFAFMNKYHSLIDKVYDYRNLLRSFRHGAKRKGCSGPDNVSWREYGDRLIHNLTHLAQRLRTDHFEFTLPASLYISGTQGKIWHIYIWNVEDRIVQRAMRQVLSPIFEKEFLDLAYGYRPRRGYAQAYKRVLMFFLKMESPWVVSTDIRSAFASVDRTLLKRLFCLRVADGKLIKLLEKALFSVDTPGLPLGNSLSPLMFDLYLHEVDKILSRRKVIRYGDNLIAFSTSRSVALEDLKLITGAVQSVGLELNDQKTRVVFDPPIDSLFQ
jgi:RNA-directed DNA polymerase